MSFGRESESKREKRKENSKKRWDIPISKTEHTQWQRILYYMLLLSVGIFIYGQVRSFIFIRAHIWLMPQTVASPLPPIQVRQRNVLKDFVQVAGLLGVTHFIIISRSDQFINLRVCRIPHGPTLTFHIKTVSGTLLVSFVPHTIDSSLLRPLSTATQYCVHNAHTINPSLLRPLGTATQYCMCP